MYLPTQCTPITLAPPTPCSSLTLAVVLYVQYIYRLDISPGTETYAGKSRLVCRVSLSLLQDWGHTAIARLAISQAVDPRAVRQHPPGGPLQLATRNSQLATCNCLSVGAASRGQPVQRRLSPQSIKAAQAESGTPRTKLSLTPSSDVLFWKKERCPTSETHPEKNTRPTEFTHEP